MPQPLPGRLVQKETLVALGGNLATASQTARDRVVAAVAAIATRIGPVTACSRIWRTPAFPAGSGPDYANAALCVATDLQPADLLTELHAIEADFGRIRQDRWGPRTLDLDLIGQGDAVLPDAATQTRWRDLPVADQARTAPADVILPHPRVQDRAFVLVPLAEVAPDWRHPVTGRSVMQMLAALPAADTGAVVPWDGAA